MVKNLRLLIVLFSFLLSTVNCVYSQVWHAGVYVDTEWPVFLLVSPSGIDLVTRGQRNQRVYRFNQTGQLVFQSGLHLWTNKPIVNYAGDFISITNRNGCDKGMGEPYIKKISKINSAGQSVQTYAFLSKGLNFILMKYRNKIIEGKIILE